MIILQLPSLSWATSDLATAARLVALDLVVALAIGKGGVIFFSFVANTVLPPKLDLQFFFFNLAYHIPSFARHRFLDFIFPFPNSFLGLTLRSHNTSSQHGTHQPWLCKWFKSNIFHPLCTHLDVNETPQWKCVSVCVCACQVMSRGNNFLCLVSCGSGMSVVKMEFDYGLLSE